MATTGTTNTDLVKKPYQKEQNYEFRKPKIWPSYKSGLNGREHGNWH